MKALLITLFAVIAGTASAQDIWIPKDSMNGSPRASSSSFVLDGEGYSICGVDDGGMRRKVYSYTFSQDDWDDEVSMGGVNGDGLDRSSASAFAIANKGYVCLGQGETNPFFGDLWELDPSTNAWTQKADFIGTPRRMSVGFSIDSLAYVGLGLDASGVKKDMYQYSPALNLWTPLSDFPGVARKEAVGFDMGGQGYVGTGDSGVLLNDFWQYEPTTDSWIQKADFPGTKRKGAVAWGLFPQAFICTGEDIAFNYKKDLWEYNYFTDTWVQRADFLGSGRTGAIAFVLQGIAFVGSGYDGAYKDDMYSYNRIVGINEMDAYLDVVLYPNPTTNAFSVRVDPTDLTLELIAIDGRSMTNMVDVESNLTGFHISGDLPSGSYIVRLNHRQNGTVFQDQIIVQ